MKLIGPVTLGRDPELRYTSEGKPILGFSGAWSYGQKPAEGYKPSQWCDFAMFGDRAERLADYLKKGQQVVVYASEVHVETYQKRGGGEGHRLVARVDDIEFVRGQRDEGEAPAPAPAPAPRAAAPAQRAPAPKPATGFDDLGDDIPF